MPKAIRVNPIQTSITENPPTVAIEQPIEETPTVGEVPLTGATETEKPSGITEPVEWINGETNAEDKIEGVVMSTGETMTAEDQKQLFFDTGIFINKSTTEFPIEERITNFIDSREAGDIKMNDFLKSLYPPSLHNQPAKWADQGNSKYLKKVLEDMQAAGKITVVNNAHRRLGEHYYDGTTGMASRHNISTIPIIVKK